MSIIKIFLVVFILSVPVVDGRALRQRRQTMTNQLGQDVNNFLSNGYNTIRDSIAPAIGSTVDRFSQNFNQGINQMSQGWDQYKQNFNQGINQGINQMSQGWDRYKQNFNQGINQMSQGWNQFTQNLNPQYPYNNNNNYQNNQYGYNAQQYPPPPPPPPPPMNYNYNVPPNMYQNYNGRQGNQYPVNNNFNGYGQQPRQNVPYYAGNMGGQWNQNFARQQPSNGVVYANRRIGSRRR